MNKFDLLKPGAPRHQELVQLAREINDRQATIETLRQHAFKGCSAWICEVALQGQALIKVKQALAHGTWLEWLKVHCPFSHDTASTYIRVATNFEDAKNLPEGTSIRQALDLLTRPAKQEHLAPAAPMPPYLEGLGRISKFCGYVFSHPVKDWPEEGKQKARQDLEPIVRELWPERFSA